MPGMHEQGKRITLAALAVICAWVVYRNLVVPAQQSVSTTGTVAGPAGTPAGASGQREGVLRPSSPALSQPQDEPGRRDRAMGQRELAALDPTLRLDLLEKLRGVKYEGGSRNIFQPYTPPPPKPVANPILPLPSGPAQSSSPPPANISLKFYGVASRPGSSEKRAFLADGDDIYVGREGDTISKNYKIIRIGVNSIELEDIRNHQRQQLPLIEE